MMKDLTPKLKTKSAEAELSVQYQAGELPFGQNLGGTQMYSNVFKRGYGDAVFGSSGDGIWLGAADFGSAPFRVDMDGNLVSSSATIIGQIKVFKQASIPTSVNVSDLWVDTDDDNKLYRAAAVGATTIAVGQWEAVDDQRAADALLQSTNTTLGAVVTVGVAGVKIDGANKRISISDGIYDRILQGYQSGGF